MPPTLGAALILNGAPARVLCPGGEGERRIVPEDRLLELAELGPRLDPELGDERLAGRAVRVERVDLPPRPVEREHQLLARTVAQRVLRHERLELGNQLSVAAESEVGVDPLL